CRATSLASPAEHLGEILVAAAGQAYEVELTLGLGEHPRQRVGSLESGDDALQAGDLSERCQRLEVCDRDVARAAAVPEVRVLGARPRIVQAGGHGVRLH